jgi:hypothetical protein
MLNSSAQQRAQHEYSFSIQRSTAWQPWVLQIVLVLFSACRLGFLVLGFLAPCTTAT